MEIEELDGPTKYEAMPTEGTLYLTAVRYSGGYWCAGPSGTNKAEVIKLLSQYSCDAARIYAVKVPLEALPAA